MRDVHFAFEEIYENPLCIVMFRFSEAIFMRKKLLLRSLGSQRRMILHKGGANQ